MNNFKCNHLMPLHFKWLICVAYDSKSSSTSEQFPMASPSARLISRSVRHDLPPTSQLRACASYQLTPGAVYRVFLPDFWRAVDYYVDTTTDVYRGGTSLSRLVFNSSTSHVIWLDVLVEPLPPGSMAAVRSHDRGKNAATIQSSEF